MEVDLAVDLAAIVAQANMGSAHEVIMLTGATRVDAISLNVYNPTHAEA